MNDADGQDALGLTPKSSKRLQDAVDSWRAKIGAEQHGFFLAKSKPASAEHVPVRENADSVNDDQSSSWKIGALAEYQNGFFEGIQPESRYICFVDPSTYPSFPGWMLRNLLILVRQLWKLEEVQILCYRDVNVSRDGPKSMILHLKVNRDVTGPAANPPLPTPKTTGWERNSAGKVVNRIANLGEYMDPRRSVNPYFGALSPLRYTQAGEPGS